MWEELWVRKMNMWGTGRVVVGGKIALVWPVTSLWDGGVMQVLGGQDTNCGLSSQFVCVVLVGIREIKSAVMSVIARLLSRT